MITYVYSLGLSVCSAGQVRGTYIQLNIRSYTQAVKCRCALTVEQKNFITIATNRVPQTEDCKSQVTLDFQSERVIHCSSPPTYFFLTEENETGNISLSTVANNHGRTEYSLYFCGKSAFFSNDRRYLFICFFGGFFN